jgi:outer membrane protein assembly factor BamB
MKKKLIGFLISILIIVATVIPVTGMVINKNIKLKKQQIIVEESSVTDTKSDDVDWWPMFHHDLNNTGYSTSKYAPQTNHILWTYTTGFFITDSPAIVNGKVYIGSDDEFFYCLNADTGKRIWYNSIPGGTSSCSPCVVNDRIYMGTTYDYFYCWDADTGEEIWKFYKGYGSSRSPAVSNGKVYIPYHEGNNIPIIYCLNANSGDVIWQKTFPDGIISHLTYYDGKVYASLNYSYGKIFCLNGENGETIWENDTGGQNGAPAIYNGKVYANADGIRCFDAETGEEIWHYLGAWSYCSPAVAYDKIYYVSSERKMICLDADNGDETWVYDIGNGYEHAVPSPAIADEKVYISLNSNAYLYCFNAFNGEVIWDYKVGIPEQQFSTPAIANGSLYIGGGSKIYCFEDPSKPPSDPSIDGPTIGAVGIEYEYAFVTKDPDGDDVKYFIDWGDNTSEWTDYNPSGNDVNVKHTWSDKGNYTIKAKAKDIHHIEGHWSELHIISIIDNLPPDAPIIDGPTKGKPGVEYTFTFNAVDPDDHDIAEYIINWRDSPYEIIEGPFASGSAVTANHTWTSQRTYTIKAKAKDICGTESNWSEFKINIPRNRATIDSLFQLFFGRFSNLFPIFRYILGL